MDWLLADRFGIGKGKSMRVMLYFVAFGVLLAIVLPLVIGTFLQEDDQITQQLRNGGDPTTILEGTASGNGEAGCTTGDYRYLESVEGYVYVQRQNSPYIAALIDDRIVTLMVREGENQAQPVVRNGIQAVDVERLSVELEQCLRSGQRPRVTELSVSAKR